MSQPCKFKFWATLLDSYQNFLDSDLIWEKFWGFSETPKLTSEQYREQCRQDLLNNINRVPLEDSTYADRGTCFNELVDCLVENRGSDKIEVEKVSQQTGYDGEPLQGHVIGLNATLNGHTFYFPIDVVMDAAKYFKGAATQVFTEGILPTKYGDVRLYGYIDELLPLSVHDIKTTSRYEIGKYKRNWQHLVYPYCLHYEGSKDLNLFEYNVYEMSSSGITPYTETYLFNEKRDTERLRKHCEGLIEFLFEHKSLITNKRVFNE